MLYFLHGFLGSPHDWHPILQKVKPMPFSTLSLPLCPHIYSAVETLANKIQEKSTLIGYSMGGRFALMIAYFFPTKVQKLILLSANLGLQTAKEIKKKQHYETLWKQKPWPQFLKDWYQQPLFSTLDPNWIETRIQQRLQDAPGFHLQMFSSYSILYQPNLWSKINQFKQEILFLYGEHDIKYSLIGKRLQKGSLCLVKMIPKSSHALHIEQPHLVAKEIKDFLLCHS